MVDKIQQAHRTTGSPCVRNCCLDDNDICLGCFRSLEEILAWRESSKEHKAQMLEECLMRRSERQR
ncbi:MULTISPECIES: DUF1289 domain-containing protein [Corallincola]|uniref:DUF1289 domain-containing protein n=3 Tax=Corallincola TaxID=1775176 RepID=A0A368N5L5_9GAMM|nr:MULTISPECIES: DUF1289 domain-containing protein [Corallincola]RCU45516.1 DUF1289 domain-containing protein [Corallincola holothuriorum]TAA40970.1 DUF1289 domain-containing protein [Corallincola spongiicola]TCI02620.1 DUF1289 domain-containing protein [Corallincola luteus]